MKIDYLGLQILKLNAICLSPILWTAMMPMNHSRKTDVLYIDYIYQKGHVNFNRIHIDALMQQGYSVSLILHKRMADALPYTSEQYIKILPDWMRLREGHPIINRLLFFASLIYIRFTTSVDNYQHVIVSSYDEMTLPFIHLAPKMYVMCHNNIVGLENPIKKFCTLLLNNSTTFVVFNTSMQKALYNMGIKHVEIISHGCLPNIPSSTHESTDETILFQASDKYDEKWMNAMIQHPNIDQILAQLRVRVILRNVCNIPSDFRQIQTINTYLSKQEYQRLFSMASIILLAYPPEFRYRVSGVSYEIISASKRALILNSEHFAYCKDFFNYNPFFKNVDDWVDRLQQLQQHTEWKCIVSPNQVTPNYHQLFNK